MRSVTLTAPSATGDSPVGIIDQHLDPMNIGLYVNFNGAFATASVEFSGDDPFAKYATSYAANAVWWPLTNSYASQDMTGLMANAVAIPTIPCRAFKLTNTAWSSGNPTLTIVQTGGIS